MNTISNLANTYGFQNSVASKSELAYAPDTRTATNTSGNSGDTVNISRAAIEKLSTTTTGNIEANQPLKNEEASEALRDKIIQLTEYLLDEAEPSAYKEISADEEKRIDKLYQKIDSLENYGLSKQQIQTRDKLDDELGELLDKDSLTQKEQDRVKELDKALGALQPNLNQAQEAQLDSLYEEVDELEDDNMLVIDPADFPEIASLNKELEQYLVAGDTENAQGVIAALTDFVFRETDFDFEPFDEHESFDKPEHFDEMELSAEQEKQIDAINQRIDTLETYGLTEKQVKQRIATYEELDALLDKDAPNQKQQSRIEQLHSTLEKPNPNLSKTQLNELDSLDKQLESIEGSASQFKIDIKDLRAISSLSSDINTILSEVIKPSANQ